jgi:acyl-homoserine lactone acylase PvdQ
MDNGPTVNLVYITQDDHIGYQAIGKYPIKPYFAEGAYVKDGTTNKYDWTGFLSGL